MVKDVGSPHWWRWAQQRGLRLALLNTTSSSAS